jgi:hypothetical protein
MTDVPSFAPHVITLPDVSKVYIFVNITLKNPLFKETKYVRRNVFDDTEMSEDEV